MSDDLISAEQAQALLDGTTPGPWEVFFDDSGGQWTGWPLSIEAPKITDKTVVRTGGQWPYEWDAKMSQHEAGQNARVIAAAPDLARTVIAQAAEITRLRAMVEAADGLAKAASAADVVLHDESYSLGAFPRLQLVAALATYQQKREGGE